MRNLGQFCHCKNRPPPSCKTATEIRMQGHKPAVRKRLRRREQLHEDKTAVSVSAAAVVVSLQAANAHLWHGNDILWQTLW